MNTKLIEIRDRATYIVALCTQMKSDNFTERYHLRRKGYDDEYPLVMVTELSAQKSSHDPFYWNDRTMHNAHLYIAKHFDDLVTGDVVDVEHILGETAEPKQSGMLRLC